MMLIVAGDNQNGEDYKCFRTYLETIMKKLLLFVFLSSFTSALFACEPGEVSFAKTNLCAKISWITAPAFNQYTSAAISLNENTDLKLNVIPWMVMSGGHEHGSRPVVITSSSPTDYLIEKIYFMGGMKGEWYLKMQLLNDKKEVVEEVRTLVAL